MTVENLIQKSREDNLTDVRLAFTAAQQSLRALHKYPAPLLDVATFHFHDASGHANIDQALDLLERELTALRTMVANQRAAVSARAHDQA